MGYGDENPSYIKSSLMFFKSDDFIKSVHIDKEFKIELIIVPYGKIYESNNIYYKEMINNILEPNKGVNNDESIQINGKEFYFDILEPFKSLSIGFNHASRKSRYDTLLFITDHIEISSIDDIFFMVHSLKEDKNVSIVGGKIRTNDYRIYSYGIDLITTYFNKNKGYLSYFQNEFDDNHLNPKKGNIIGILNRYQGYPSYDPRTLSMTNKVDGLSKSLMMISKKDFNYYGGFDEKYNKYFFDVDLCQRVMNDSKKILIVPYTDVIYNGNIDEGEDDDFSNDDIYLKDGNEFSSKWFNIIKEKEISKYDLKNITLTWLSDCQFYSIGKNENTLRDLMGYISMFWKNIHMKLVSLPSLTTLSNKNDCESILKKIGYPIYDRKLFKYIYERDISNNNNKVLYISHPHEQSRYASSFFSSHQKSDVNIGLINKDNNNNDEHQLKEWITKSNIHLIWSNDDNKGKMKSYGFNETMIRYIPDIIDMNHFNPMINHDESPIISKEIIQYSPIRGMNKFNFLLLIKWDDGDDDNESHNQRINMYKSFIDVFKNNNDVSLYIMSDKKESNKKEYEDFIEKYKNENDIPKINFINDMIHYWNLPSFYRSIQSLIIMKKSNENNEYPYKRIILESMAMEIPIIGINNNEDDEEYEDIIINKENIYNVNMKKEGELKEKLRYVYENYNKEPLIKGKKERQIMLKRYGKKHTLEKIKEEIKYIISNMNEIKESKIIKQKGKDPILERQYNYYGNNNNNMKSPNKNNNIEDEVMINGKKYKNVIINE